MAVTFGGVLGTSISILPSLSFHCDLASSNTSSNVDIPVSFSALAQAWSAEMKDTPTRMTISSSGSKENKAPDW